MKKGGSEVSIIHVHVHLRKSQMFLYLCKLHMYMYMIVYMCEQLRACMHPANLNYDFG